MLSKSFASNVEEVVMAVQLITCQVSSRRDMKEKREMQSQVRGQFCQ